MQINNSTYSCKPRKFGNFTGNESSEKATKKVRYKHYEEMSDDVLKLKSVLSAHKEVENSGKMRLFKALPEITTVLLGTTIALAQPGKLAAKAGSGLGFLALAGGLYKGGELIEKHIDNKNKENKTQKNDKKVTAKKIAKTALGVTAGIAATTMAAVGLVKTKSFSKVTKFVSKETQQLASEINNTKVAKFMDEKIVPFTQKHAAATKIAKATAPVGVIVTNTLVALGLADSLSNDIKSKATNNYVKGKAIQEIARKHFDSIEAEEV